MMPSPTGVKTVAARSVKPVSVDVCRSLEELETLRAGWQELVSACDNPVVFQTWDWLYTWTERFVRDGRRLFAVAVSDGSRMIGLAPMYICTTHGGPLPVQALGFLGLPETGSDYLDIIARKGKEQVVTQAVLDALFGRFRSEWDILALQEVPSDSQALASLLLHLRRAGKHYAVEDGSYCPRIALPDSFDSYFATLSGHRRQQYKREMKILFASQAVEHRVVAGHDAIAQALPVFRQLYERRWGANAGDLFGFIEAYIRRTRADDAVELSALMVGERMIAGLLHLNDGPVKRMYLMAVDREFNPAISLGNLICGLNIELAIKSGFRAYDFLKGDESYKTLWMNAGRRAVHVTIHNRTLPSLAAYVARSSRGLGKILVRSR